MIELKDSFLGYGKSLHKLVESKSNSILEKLTRYEGKVMTRKDFIVNVIIKGFNRPEVHEYEEYLPRAERYENKVKYRLFNDDEECYTLNKTEHLFARHCVEKGYTTEEAVIRKVNEDMQEIADIKQKQIEKQKQEQKEQEEARQKENNYNEWLENEIENYEVGEAYEMAKSIYLHEIGQYSDYAIKKLLIMIDNVDCSITKQRLINWLHIGNPASKKAFSYITGVNIHNKTNKETESILKDITKDDFTGMKEYKVRKKPQEAEKETFYIYSIKNTWEEATGEKLKKYGLDLFIRKNERGMYSITEGTTGRTLINGYKTKKELMEGLKNLEPKIEFLNEKIEESIKISGISPLYA